MAFRARILGEAGQGQACPTWFGMTRRPKGKAGPPRHARFPHVDHGGLFRHRSADGHLVREERPQHLRHAPVHPPAVRGGGPGLGVQIRLGHLQGTIAKKFSARSRPRCWAVEHDVVLTPIQHDSPGEMAQPFEVQRLVPRASARPFRARPCPRSPSSSGTIRTLYKQLHSPRPAAGKTLGNGGKGLGWKTGHEVDLNCKRPQRRRA